MFETVTSWFEEKPSSFRAYDWFLDNRNKLTQSELVAYFVKLSSILNKHGLEIPEESTNRRQLLLQLASMCALIEDSKNVSITIAFRVDKPVIVESSVY